ncbi:MAG: GAF domain-containing protein [Cyanobacteria bacterium P01_G01_bin.19]
MSDPGLEKLLHRLSDNLREDRLVQNVADDVRNKLDVDRVVLYYFYRQWEGRVTFESLSHQKYSILGSTGPDECFNGEYAELYLNGRVRAIADINNASIAECHQEFLQQIEVKANLVVPILTSKGLWGLLVAHHCQSPFDWSEAHVLAMKAGAAKLAEAKAIQNA